MIVLLGSTGYVGQAFSKYLTWRKSKFPFVEISRSKDFDYTDPKLLRNYLSIVRPKFLINCAGYTGKPNVDACESDRGNCLFANAVFPAYVATICADLKIPWGHVSSGCIYTSDNIINPTKSFDETISPNFDFRAPKQSYYSGTKSLGEENILTQGTDYYIWRLRIPFNQMDNPRNYITKILTYNRLLEARNSFSQLDEFVWACCECYEKKLPYGIYNVTNPGSMLTSEIVEMINQRGISNKEFQFFKDEDEFNNINKGTFRSNCVLNSDKLGNAGVRMMHVRDAFEIAFFNWKESNYKL